MDPTEAAILAMGLLKQSVFSGNPVSSARNYFCVPEANGRKRAAMNQLLEICSTNTAISKEWAWKALSLSEWDPIKAVAWLAEVKIL